jgi:hypothetical protein
MRTKIIKILNLLLINSIILTISAKSIFFAENQNIVGFEDLVQAIFPNSKKDKSVIIIPSKNDLMTYVAKITDDNDNSYIISEQINIITHEIVNSLDSTRKCIAD